MTARQPIGVISIGSNDIHLLVATSDGIGTFDRQVNQSTLAELVGPGKGGVVPAKALGQALHHLYRLATDAGRARSDPFIAAWIADHREAAHSPPSAPPHPA